MKEGGGLKYEVYTGWKGGGLETYTYMDIKWWNWKIMKGVVFYGPGP